MLSYAFLDAFYHIFNLDFSVISWRLSSEVDDFPAETFSIGRSRAFARPRHDDDASALHHLFGSAMQVNHFRGMNSDESDDDEG
jgi:hypothetical protein